MLLLTNVNKLEKISLHLEVLMDKLYLIKRGINGKGAFCLLKTNKQTKQEQGYWVELWLNNAQVIEQEPNSLLGEALIWEMGYVNPNNYSKNPENEDSYDIIHTIKFCMQYGIRIV